MIGCAQWCSLDPVSFSNSTASGRNREYMQCLSDIDAGVQAPKWMTCSWEDQVSEDEGSEAVVAGDQSSGRRGYGHQWELLKVGLGIMLGLAVFN
jgi:hypothetical protein